jgi:tetraacyldisaccharide 4'-kinase
VVDLRAFPDHHAYTAEDVADLSRWAAASGADLALTTQKDSVKLRLSELGDAPLRALRIGLELLGDARPLEDLLARLLPEGGPIADD